jgi:hypothetical protein
LRFLVAQVFFLGAGIGELLLGLAQGFVVVALVFERFLRRPQAVALGLLGKPVDLLEGSQL